MTEQREKLIELLKNEPISLNRIAEKRADYLIANGVVVLPCRCGGCRHSIGESIIDGQTICLLHDEGVDKDDFCSYAKRKGGDDL